MQRFCTEEALGIGQNTVSYDHSVLHLLKILHPLYLFQDQASVGSHLPICASAQTKLEVKVLVFLLMSYFATQM